MAVVDATSAEIPYERLTLPDSRTISDHYDHRDQTDNWRPETQCE